MNNELVIRKIKNKLKLNLPLNLFSKTRSIIWILEVIDDSLKLKLIDSNVNYSSENILFEAKQVIKKENNRRFLIIPPKIIALYNLKNNSKLNYSTYENYILINHDIDDIVYSENYNKDSLPLIYREPIKIRKSGTGSFTIPPIIVKLMDLNDNDVLNSFVYRQGDKHFLVLSRINELIYFPECEKSYNTVTKIYQVQENSLSTSAPINKKISEFINPKKKNYLYISMYINYNLSYITLEE